MYTMTESAPHRNGVVPISSGRMVRFATNVPTEIALQCVDGVRVEGRYGDRVKYTLTDDRTMHVPPFVADRIRELEIQPGEVFQVCKRQAKKGNRKTIHWAVERGDAETQLERDLRDSLAIATHSDIAMSPAPASEVITTPDTHVPPPSPFHELEHSAPDDVTRNGNGRRNCSGNVAATSPPSADNGLPGPPDTQLAHALKTAIAAAANAEEFAKTLDYNIRFTTEDVRSMGITVLIGMQQRQR
jgi:hypothetical protein